MSVFQHSDTLQLPQWQLIALGTALFTLGFISRPVITPAPAKTITASPLKTLLPRLTASQIFDLPYPPDALPGARDIVTPNGSFRVYEFGPAEGRKVLLVHGISTPCLALGGLAHALVDKGCRVMLFDLPGRGYSDTPDDLDHDMRLFSAQIFSVLASSELSWVGQGSGDANGKTGFAMVGYSLGGGISAAFTSYFPNLVNSLVLIAPSGLIREKHISRTSRILYRKTSLFEPVLMKLVRRRLMKPVEEKKGQQPSDDTKADTETAVQAEVNIEANQKVVLSKKHPNITINSAVNHQIENHQGFVAAFMSSIRNGPIQRQHELWRKIGKQMVERKEKVLVVLGDRDPIIKYDEIKEDSNECLMGQVEFATIKAGHEAPVAHGPEVADAIWSFWENVA